VSRRTPDAAQSITSAPSSLAADQARRQRAYLQQMGVRVLCFLLAVLLWQHVPLWVSLLLIVGAVVLPYTAVLFANAGRERPGDGPPPVLPPLLAPGAAPGPGGPGVGGAGPAVDPDADPFAGWTGPRSSPWPRRDESATDAPGRRPDHDGPAHDAGYADEAPTGHHDRGPAGPGPAGPRPTHPDPADGGPR
jgi:hypothetical protein